MNDGRPLLGPEGSEAAGAGSPPPAEPGQGERLTRAQALLRKARESKIRAFEQSLLTSRHEDQWQRSPNVTGTGAIHVKSFHCKLTEESLHYMDQQINEWLDAHPQYEVKFVTTAVGEWTGKTKEPNLIVQVWV